MKRHHYCCELLQKGKSALDVVIEMNLKTEFRIFRSFRKSLRNTFDYVAVVEDHDDDSGTKVDNFDDLAALIFKAVVSDLSNLPRKARNS